MYAAIRQGKAKAGMAEALAQTIKEGAIPIISDVPGFKAYYVIYAPDDTVTAISEAARRIRLIARTIDARPPVGDEFCTGRSVGEAQRRNRALSHGLLHTVAIGFRRFVVVDDYDAVVLHLEHVVSDRLADSVACALVEIDFHPHGHSPIERRQAGV